jgi:hypothetical protein
MFPAASLSTKTAEKTRETRQESSIQLLRILMRDKDPKRNTRSKKQPSKDKGREEALNADKPSSVRHNNEQETDFEQVLAEEGRRANLTAVRHGSSHNEKYAAMRATRRGSDDELAA